ncbi:hypothetical protein [Runella limosa]|uniref:hypothetical protein n=1 Tax=Runella limosa TaxID=370978 RepID=UPI0003F6A692|nr:hypothetical protein [Runella limosa]
MTGLVVSKFVCKYELTHIRTGSSPAANTGSASGGAMCKLGALYFYSSSVLVDSFVLRNPPERQARERYQQC